jgi:hypothetical protein
MEKLKQILTDKKTKTALWQIANGVISITIVLLGEFDLYLAPVINTILNAITKEINKHYL